MRKTICTCDKCKKETDPAGLWLVSMVVRHPGSGGQLLESEKDYCRNCLTELFPGFIVSDNSPKIDHNLTRITIGEKFEEIVREICREEIEEGRE